MVTPEKTVEQYRAAVAYELAQIKVGARSNNLLKVSVHVAHIEQLVEELLAAGSEK